MTGRFLRGNSGGPGGNRSATQAAALRAILYDAVDQENFRRGVKALLEKMAEGNVQAAKLVLQYTLGEPQSIDLISTIARLEAVVLRGVI